MDLVGCCIPMLSVCVAIHHPSGTPMPSQMILCMACMGVDGLQVHRHGHSQGGHAKTASSSTTSQNRPTDAMWSEDVTSKIMQSHPHTEVDPNGFSSLEPRLRIMGCDAGLPRMARISVHCHSRW